VLVGPHGSAMYHMLWLPPDAVVFELDSDNKYTIFWTLASSLGLKYARLRYKGKLDAQTLLSLLRTL
jgi:capsular polysaccharide biosynthesis protein